MGKQQTLRSEQSGVAYVEFLIAFVPLFFGAMPMLSRRATVELAAAIPLFRLAPASGNTVQAALGFSSWDDAVKKTLAALTLDLNVRSGAQGNVHREHIDLKLSYTYHCSIPIAREVICPGGVKIIHAKRSVINQRAVYQYRVN
ncbi:MAG: hypothetical protein IPJ88_06060 [Myxococcales bacterium]|nr:MAG: hypothetical protein IPJ88_06060 [Myxococcales bacterium]